MTTKQLAPRLKPQRWEKRPSRAHIFYQTQRLLLLIIGAVILSLGYAIFQVPHNIVAGGISGISIILNHFTGWRPVGLTYWLMNVPLLILGFYQLGRWSFLWRTLIAATVFAVCADVFIYYMPYWLPQYPLSHDLLLNTIYGGIVEGLGLGLVYRAGGTTGGTSIVGRIVQKKTGQPLSQVYFYADGVIIVSGAIVFGWEIALYGFLLLFVSGLASDYGLEGPSRTRTVTIITNTPEPVLQALFDKLERGASYWPIVGGYTGETHYLVYCTITRPQVQELRHVVAEADPNAFVTIGVGHQALGYGFTPLKERR